MKRTEPPIAAIDDGADACPAPPSAKRPRSGLGTPMEGADFPAPPPFLTPLQLGELKEHQLVKREIIEQSGETLRHVVPYCHSFKTSVKGRWLNRSLIDVFSSEFGSHDREYFQRAIEIGTLRVNNAKVPPSLILGNNHHITHIAHRHEPDVAATPIELIHEEKDEDGANGGGFIVVNKPAGIPVHPCGPCNFNSVLSLLVSEGATSSTHEGEIYRANALLAPVHRLDRLTSGVLILAKPAPKAGSGFSTAAESTAAKICRDIRDGKVQKRYAARVKGQFPVFMTPASTSAGDAFSVASPDSVKGTEKSAFLVAPCPPSSGCVACSQNKSTASSDGSGAGASAADPFIASFAPALSGEQTSSGLDEHARETPPPAAPAPASSSAADDAKAAATAPVTSPAGAEPVRWSVGWRCPYAVARAGFSPAPWRGETLPSPAAAAADSPAASGTEAEGRQSCFIQVDIALITVDTKNARQGVATTATPVAASPAPVPTSAPDLEGAAALPAGTGRDSKKQQKLKKSKHPYAIVPESGAVALPAAPKESVTLFRRVAYDPITNESLVECRPLQGRSHQIRVHLAWLGFPIADDPMYCDDALKALHERDARELEREVSAAAAAAAEAVGTSSSSEGNDSASSAAAASSDMEALARSLCVTCNHPSGLRKELNVMQRLCRGISLHSWSYYTTGDGSTGSSETSSSSSPTAGGGRCFTAALPQWAKKFGL